MTTAALKIEKFQNWSSKVVNSNSSVKIRLMRKGVEAQVIVSASEYFKMPRAQLAKMIGMSPATAERKIKSRSLLGPLESERLGRLAFIENTAEKVFGSSEMARDWMLRENIALGDTPFAMLDTETGATEVKKILASIAYGGAV